MSDDDGTITIHLAEWKMRLIEFLMTWFFAALICGAGVWYIKWLIDSARVC